MTEGYFTLHLHPPASLAHLVLICTLLCPLFPTCTPVRPLYQPYTHFYSCTLLYTPMPLRPFVPHTPPCIPCAPTPPCVPYAHLVALRPLYPKALILNIYPLHLPCTSLESDWLKSSNNPTSLISIYTYTPNHSQSHCSVVMV